MSELEAAVETLEAVPVDHADDVFANPELSAKMESSEDMDSMSDEISSVNEDSEVLDTPENRAYLNAVKERLKMMNTQYWDLAKDIAAVHNKKLYKLLGYKKFKQYVSEEIGMDGRRGYYYVRIYNYFSTTLKSILADKPELYNDFLSKVKQMGWSKASTIASDQPISSDNAEEVIARLTLVDEKGKMPSYRELEKLCKTEKGKMSQDTQEEIEEKNDVQKYVSANFSLTLAQDNDVRSALDHARKVAKPGAKKSTLLSWICRDYLSTNMGATGGDVGIEDIMARYESLSEFDIIVFDRATGEIKYGKDNIEHMPGD